MSCLSAQSAAETRHPLLLHIKVQPRQDDETTGNVLFTKAPQLTLNSLPSVVGGGKAKHGQTSLQTSKTGLIQRETCLCLKIISVQSRLSTELPLAHRAVYVSSAVTEANCMLLKRISCHFKAIAVISVSV